MTLRKIESPGHFLTKDRVQQKIANIVTHLLGKQKTIQKDRDCADPLLYLRVDGGDDVWPPNV
jgi:hypothetical protein